MKFWYGNKDVDVFFDDVPCIGIRYVVPSDTDIDKKAKKRYPFINRRALDVRLTDKRKGLTYGFTIPKSYCFDGATVPRFFWRVIGPNTDNAFLVAAMIHDAICENHYYVNRDRHFSTVVFNALLEASNVTPVKRFFMKHSVDLFQRFGCDWSM